MAPEGGGGGGRALRRAARARLAGRQAPRRVCWGRRPLSLHWDLPLSSHRQHPPNKGRHRLWTAACVVLCALPPPADAATHAARLRPRRGHRHRCPRWRWCSLASASPRAALAATPAGRRPMLLLAAEAATRLSPSLHRCCLALLLLNDVPAVPAGGRGCCAGGTPRAAALARALRQPAVVAPLRALLATRQSRASSNAAARPEWHSLLCNLPLVKQRARPQLRTASAEQV